mmetsp:Transcript_103528/g.205781  ORF Transcript_103528/g.205781 Transcript_103528/m.205781 type:complete len:206 (+) Transcript_103528:77-694(+)
MIPLGIRIFWTKACGMSNVSCALLMPEACKAFKKALSLGELPILPSMGLPMPMPPSIGLPMPIPFIPMPMPPMAIGLFILFIPMPPSPPMPMPSPPIDPMLPIGPMLPPMLLMLPMFPMLPMPPPMPPAMPAFRLPDGPIPLPKLELLGPKLFPALPFGPKLLGACEPQLLVGPQGLMELAPDWPDGPKLVAPLPPWPNDVCWFC